MDFPGNKGCQFLNIPIIYVGAKNHKKLTAYFWEKCELIERLTDNSDFMGLSVGYLSKKSILEQSATVFERKK